jgi:hypothetical protein
LRTTDSARAGALLRSADPSSLEDVPAHEIGDVAHRLEHQGLAYRPEISVGIRVPRSVSEEIEQVVGVVRRAVAFDDFPPDRAQAVDRLSKRLRNGAVLARKHKVGRRYAAARHDHEARFELLADGRGVAPDEPEDIADASFDRDLPLVSLVTLTSWISSKYSAGSRTS